jgi:uncharacterized protein (DUF1330 family)
MNVVNHVYPNFEQLMPLANDPTPGPIAMVNLLRFRDKAEYADGRAEDVSGREAYMRYVAEMGPLVEAAGGRFLFSGEVKGLVIGEVEDLWDAVGIAEYPSRAAFHRIATSKDVLAIGVHREAGLAGQLLIMTVGEILPPVAGRTG